ncbi:hypothetical protein PT2222_10111 [Paraburkholderia tropica]
MRLGLLLDGAVAGPEALVVGVRGVHELDVVAHHAHHAIRLVLGRREAAEIGEIFLHLLMLARLLVLGDGVELVPGEAAVGAGFELHGLLRLDRDRLRLLCLLRRCHANETRRADGKNGHGGCG